jgi:outer membrane receptor protein involved in Fe transport
LTSGLFRHGGEWIASVRRSNLDFLYDAFSTRPERPRYVDAFARVSYKLTAALRVTANALYFRDDVSLNDDIDVEEQASANDEDRYTWLRFDHTVGAALTGATLIARTRLRTDRMGTTAQDGVGEGNLEDHRNFAIDSLQSGWSWQGDGPVRVQFGASASRVSGTYDYRDQADFDVLFDAPGAPTEVSRVRAFAIQPAGTQHSVYASIRVNPTPRLTTDIGLRWDKQTLDPADTGSTGPRIGLRYQLNGHTLLRASFGRFFQSQSINELQIADGDREYFQPQRSEHTIVGLEHEFPGGTLLRVEAYEKDMHQLRPRYENLLNGLTLLPELKPDRIRIAPDSARARGLEVVVTAREPSLVNWWVGYSWSRAHDRIDGLDVLRSWDQTHALNAGLTRDTPKWNAALAFMYRTGWPTTSTGFDVSATPPIIEARARNSIRASAYRSIDLRLTRKFAFDGSALSVFVELSNVFDYRNHCCTEYQVEQTDGGERSLDLSGVDYLPLVPSVGIVWSF